MAGDALCFHFHGGCIVTFDFLWCAFSDQCQCVNAILEYLRFVELVEASSWIEAIAWSLVTKQTCSCRHNKLYFRMLLFLACVWILCHVYLRPPA